MLYELHITVDQSSNVMGFQRAAARSKAKALQIELSHGENPLQMMTAGTHEGDDGSAVGWGLGVQKIIADAGFNIVRTKMEVPLDYGIGQYIGAPYHECHVKVLCPSDEVKLMIARAKHAEWIVSRNLWYTEVAGLEKWYLTKREYNITALAAAKEFHDSWDRVKGKMPVMARMEMETVIGDTNPGLDAGWA